MRKLIQSRGSLSLCAALCFVLSAPPFDLWPLVFAYSFFLTSLGLRSQGLVDGFLWGLLAAAVATAGTFSWLSDYFFATLHLSTLAGSLLLAVAWGLGSLHIALYVSFVSALGKLLDGENTTTARWILWLTLGFPALFGLLEFCVPTSIPWYTGYALYRMKWLTQGAELGGMPFLSFAVFSAGSALCALWSAPSVLLNWRARTVALAIPISLWASLVGFAASRLHHYRPPVKVIDLLAVQTNFGLAKRQSSRSAETDLAALAEGEALTDRVLRQGKAPDLILWPEGALPASPDSPSPVGKKILEMAKRWKVAWITGGPAIMTDSDGDHSDFDAAYLFREQLLGRYEKTRLTPLLERPLLAPFHFGLERWYPVRSSLSAGDQSPVLELSKETRVGIALGIEDLFPMHTLKAARKGALTLISLSDDSFLGSYRASEQHAAATTFRSIETRLPMARVTSTGVSELADAMGLKMGHLSLDRQGFIRASFIQVRQPPGTLYVRYGDWFVVVCLVIFDLLLLLLFRNPGRAQQPGGR